MRHRLIEAILKMHITVICFCLDSCPQIENNLKSNLTKLTRNLIFILDEFVLSTSINSF